VDDVEVRAATVAGVETTGRLLDAPTLGWRSAAAASRQAGGGGAKLRGGTDSVVSLRARGARISGFGRL
jgi:hypothetical protein